MEPLCAKLFWTGSLLLSIPSIPDVEGVFSLAGSIGGFGLLFWLVKHLMSVIKHQQDTINALNVDKHKLLDEHINRCKQCDFVQASNKEFLKERKNELH